MFGGCPATGGGPVCCRGRVGRFFGVGVVAVVWVVVGGGGGGALACAFASAWPNRSWLPAGRPSWSAVRTTSSAVTEPSYPGVGLVSWLLLSLIATMYPQSASEIC